jgi:putative pyoverdin transport system ATP-binding/permease protein
LSRRILGAPLRSLEELGPHRLLASLTDDIPTITNAFTFIPVLCINFAVLLGAMIYLGYLYWPGLIAWLIFMAIGIVSYRLPVNRSLKYFKQARELGDALYKQFRALTDGTKELKLHRNRREAFLLQSLQGTAESVRHYNIVGNTIYTAANSWGGTLFFVFIGLTVFALPAFKPVDIHILTGYTLTILYMTAPLQVILNVFPMLTQANVAINKVESLGLSLAKQPAEVSSDDKFEADEEWKKIDLVNVTHTYYREKENRSFTLGPINLSLQPGEMVFLIGGNGSGKTTLAKLLTGLYKPDTGHIEVDGETINDENRDRYRQYFSVVFADFFLFDSFLGLQASQLEQHAGKYLVQLQLDHKVEIKDGKLSTTDLSQGQRKRLALLTSYLEDRQVYLFDEWAADQDPLFKEVFYHQLLPELKRRGKTVIVITHDDKYYHTADRLVKLESGSLEFDNINNTQLGNAVFKTVL